LTKRIEGTRPGCSPLGRLGAKSPIRKRLPDQRIQFGLRPPISVGGYSYRADESLDSLLLDTLDFDQPRGYHALAPGERRRLPSARHGRYHRSLHFSPHDERQDLENIDPRYQPWLLDTQRSVPEERRAETLIGYLGILQQSHPESTTTSPHAILSHLQRSRCRAYLRNCNHHFPSVGRCFPEGCRSSIFGQGYASRKGHDVALNR